jgi:predicted glycoside hydrolase/deacetylase ChbG (UPF0249 family)
VSALPGQMPASIPANLRINADDFGLTPAISGAILAAAHEGLINSVSVVPFHDAESERLLQQLLALPQVRIGAHLTYIEIPLLTRPAAFPGGLPPASYQRFLAAYLRGRIDLDDVRAEWRAQLDLLRDRLGARPIHHLDGHQHLHHIPRLWQVARELQREYQVAVMRRSREATWRAWLKDFPMGAGLQALAWSRPGPADERFFGVGTSMRFTATAYAPLAAEIAAHPEQRYELMVHPGADQRGQRELEELRRWLQRAGR